MTHRLQTVRTDSAESPTTIYGRTVKSDASNGIRHAEPLSGAKTVMVAGESAATRKLLGTVIRNQLRCRVVEASSLAEGQYLAAVEEKIHLVLIGFANATKQDTEFAHWFHSVFPQTKVLVASGSLWELGSEPDERVLVAKSYTREELVSAIRRLLDQSATQV
jgi:DNA-binding NarL/FixJ family response regulator